MFKRDHHRRIATILQSLNTDLLDQHSCLFGGGTAIVLARGEYRESVDVDFLVSERAGYQALRHLLTGKDGINSITRTGMLLHSARAIRADQYGIRTMLLADSIEIKFEIVFESRITLEPPQDSERICGVSALTALDMATTTLLANSDRWSDDSVHSRDLIDLAMVGFDAKHLQPAIEKAKIPYGDSIERDLIKAINSLRQRKGRLAACMDALKMDEYPKAQLWQKIKDLVK